MKNYLPNFFKKYKNHLLFSLLTTLATVLAFLTIYSFLPPKINILKTNSEFPIDSRMNLTVWGFVDKKSISATTNSKTPLKITWKRTWLPFKNHLQIESAGLLSPKTNYEVLLKTQNLYGIESTENLIFKTSGLPKIASNNFLSKKDQLPPSTEFTFTLEKPIEKAEVVFASYPNFEYEQEFNGKEVLIKPKKLKQSQEYKISLYLKSQSRFLGPLFESSVFTTAPLVLSSASPSNEQTTVLKTSSLNFGFNKPVDKDSFEKDLLIDPPTPGQFFWSDQQTVEFKPNELLKTGTRYKLSLGEKLVAEDGSELEETKNLTFDTAGPVKVVSFSPSGGFPYVTTQIEVDFDQPVDQTSAQDHFSIQPQVSGSFSWQGNKLIFKPSSLASVTDYKITITPGIKTIGGEDSQDSFSTSFTTTSELNKTIGYSVQKRAINATYFGVGGKKILLVGTLHGSEANTGNMLTQWASYLRNNQKQIPSDRSFILVPFSNPDGRVRNHRFNNNGVDLNRNWATPDWQSLTYWQNRSYPSGGGSAPFSEPETQALRNLILNENPVAIITYHSAANMVIGGGIANNFGNWYSSLTGYNRVVDDGEHEGCESALGYCITGTLEEWSTIRGIPTLVIEFISSSSSEYERNLPALKGLLNYPF